MTNREAISLLRNKLREVNADSIYFNKFLFYSFLNTTKWLIKREYIANKLLLNKILFQKIPCLATEKINKSDCPEIVKANFAYKTLCKMPKMWEYDGGPIVLRISSIDNYTEYKVLSSSQFENKIDSPYKKIIKQKYCYYEDGYFYFLEDPKRISIRAFFINDVSDLDCECNKPSKNCVKFLDGKIFLPEGLEAEAIEKTFQSLFNTSRIQVDEAINKNPNIRN